MPKIEVDVSDELADQLRIVAESEQGAQLRGQQCYDALTEEQRAEHQIERPVVEADERCWERVLEAGAASLLRENRYANSVLGLRPRGARLSYSEGSVVHAEAVLPVGTELLSMQAAPEDGPNWDLVSLTFGTMNVVDYQVLPLSTVLRLTQWSGLGAFAHKRTKVDVAVYATLRCKTEGATLSGYSMFLYREEQLCAIQCRLEDAPVRDTDPHVFCYVLRLAPDTSREAVVDVLARLRALLDKMPRVLPALVHAFNPHRIAVGTGGDDGWSDGRVALVRATPASVDIEVRARVSGTGTDCVAAREALLLGVLGVAETSKASVVPGLPEYDRQTLAGWYDSLQYADLRQNHWPSFPQYPLR